MDHSVVRLRPQSANEELDVPDPNDRRSHPRVWSSGTARVYRSLNVFDDFVIRDLSTAGARLIGTARLREGARIRVVMNLHGAAVELIAEVVRTDAQKAEVAVRFHAVAPDAQAAIEHAVTSMIEGVRATRPPSVLVLHSDEAVRASLERDVSRLGRRATLCATPLEALWALDDSSASHVAAIVGTELGDRAVEFVVHIATVHPGLRRVLLFGEHLAPVDREIAPQVQAVLRVPWRIRALARAIGVELTDTSRALLPTEPDN